MHQERLPNCQSYTSSGLPDNAIHQISFSLEKNSVLHNTHSIVSHRLSICTLKLFLTMKTRVLPDEKASWIWKTVMLSGVPCFPGGIWKVRPCTVSFHKAEMLGMLYSAVKLSRVFGGSGTFLPTGRQMLPGDLHLSTELGNSKFQPRLFGVWLQTPLKVT